MRRLLAWGAVNANDSTAPTQVRFRRDYSGGWRTHGRAVWRTFANKCSTYDGPRLAWLLTACKAPDGSFWALQSWQRLLPGSGRPIEGRRGAWELRLSHWRGEPAVLDVAVNWAQGRFDHLFGRLTYRGLPVYGRGSTPRGNPLDPFGRNVYLDTYNSAYGPGWRRENAFLTHRGSGAFCYGVFTHPTGQSGKGERYRATVIGPGVTPDVMWEGAAPGRYDARLDAVANASIRQLGSNLCKPS